MSKNHWLVKQEPETYAWSAFVADGKADWTGVRNFQARNNLRAMKKDDAVLYYHSVSDREIVGIARVVREAFPDSTADEGDWSAVTLSPDRALGRPVSLDEMKVHPVLKDMPLIRQSRLSVMPVTPEQFAAVLQLSKMPVPTKKPPK